MKRMNDELMAVERNFRELILRECEFCRFGEYLKEHPEFEFSKITEDFVNAKKRDFITIPGLMGGFMYFVENTENGLTLYAEESSRMDYSSDDYAYFAVTKDESRMLKGEEREVAIEKFRKLP